MTQYYASIAVPIAALTGLDVPVPMPRPLNGSSHYSDGALIPMQILVSPYVEAPIIADTDLTSRFSKLYAPHTYEPKSIFPPHDKRPRQYSFYLEEGLSVGGVSFDEDHLGGPKGIQAQFVPGTIQWDSGKHGGGVGWLSVSLSSVIKYNADTVGVADFSLRDNGGLGRIVGSETSETR